MAEVHSAIADNLVNHGYNFLAIDFDHTFISIHTGGRWLGSMEDLVPHVRPMFLSLVPACNSRGIALAIVTFSGQIDLIRSLLESIFPDFGHKIFVRGRDSSWDWARTRGKEAFMDSAAKELMKLVEGLHITKRTSVLLDDDTNNISLAINSGITAVAFQVHDENA